MANHADQVRRLQQDYDRMVEGFEQELWEVVEEVNLAREKVL